VVARTPPSLLSLLGLLIGLPVAVGCGAEPTTRTRLVEHHRWVLLTEGDPFAHEDEAALPCDPAGYREEPPSFAVETGLCDHATFMQPTLAPARAGDLLHARAWHLPLFSPQVGAVAHLEVRVGERTLLEYRTDIPAEETTMFEYVELEEAVPAGTPVWFHVHNHGNNEWGLLEISSGPDTVYGDVP